MKLSRQNYKRNFVFIGFLSLYCYTERLRPQHTWCIPAQERPIGETRIRSWKWIFPLDNGRPRWASSSGQNSWSRTALRHSHLPSWRATIRQRTLSVSGIHGSNGRSSPCVSLPESWEAGNWQTWNGTAKEKRISGSHCKTWFDDWRLATLVHSQALHQRGPQSGPMGVQRMSADGEPTASHGCGWLWRVILSADEPQMKAWLVRRCDLCWLRP